MTTFTGSSQVTHIFQFESAPIVPALGRHAILLVVDGSDSASAILVNELLGHVEAGQVQGSDLYILDISAPGAQAFAGQNEWLQNLPALPYAVVYRHGLRAESFPLFHASYLLARLQRLAFGPVPSSGRDVFAAHGEIVAAG
jgi:ABC-type Fe2+-enterobactin transport system substrate-binding protein